MWSLIASDFTKFSAGCAVFAKARPMCHVHTLTLLTACGDAIRSA